MTVALISFQSIGRILSMMASLADEASEKYSVGWEKLEEDLTCSSCGDLFLEPRTLSCSHTFCTKCINDNLTVKKKSTFLIGYIDQPPKNFSCFTCKASFSEKELQQVPKNVSMECLISMVKKRRTYMKAINEKDEDASDLTVMCTQCEEGAPATRWCLICEDAEICEECYKSHCRLKIFKSHKVIELEEFVQSPSCILNCRPHCTVHKTQLLDRHCKTCHMFICQHCTNLDNCNKHLCKAHDYESIDDVYESKAQKIKEINANLLIAQQAVIKKLESIEHTNQELNQKIDEEIAWVQERLQEIHKLVDKCEKDLLLNLETVRSTGEKLLHEQSRNMSQRDKQLTHYKQFTSNILLPFRLQEIFMYSDWITSKWDLEEMGVDDDDDNDADVDDDDDEKEEGEDDDGELVYRTEDMVISRGSLDLDDLTQKLLSLHQIFHHPHIPSCSVQLLSEDLALVKVKVTLKDKYGMLVPNQMSHLDIQSEKDKSFFTKLSWKNEGRGVYTLSYSPLVRELHNLSVIYKDVVLGGTDLLMYDSIKLSRTVGFQSYNKRSLVKPLFLAKTPEGCIISDPGDTRLVVMTGKIFFYDYVITNYNYPNFSPAGIAVGLDNSCLYVANSGEDCIYRYDRYPGLGFQYKNISSTRFGVAGTKDGQFQCPQGLAMSKCGRLYICDRNNHRIQIYDTTNKQECFCYTCGQEEGLFNHPTDIALNKEEDKLFITDTDNHKVQVFTLPSPLSTICHAYFIDFNHMQNPFGICCTNEGLVWVTSTDRVLVFKEDGTFNTGCEFEDEGPAGIIATSKGEIIIAFTKSRKVVCYTH